MAAVFVCVAGFLSSAWGGTVITANLPANTAIININAIQDGAGSYNGDQSLWYKPFYTGGASQLLEYTVQPGTYSFRIVNPATAAQLYPALTSDETNQIFSAWSYNSPWVSDYLVFDVAAATDTSVAQLFDGSPDPSGYDNATAAYNGSVAGGYYNKIRTGPTGRDSTTITNTYTFASAETLIFAVPDYGLTDNHGGVSVLISPYNASGNPPVARAWTGASDNNWFNANNWNPVGVPATNDTIYIGTTGTINLTSPVTINGVLSWAGGTLTGSSLTVATNGVLNLTGSGAKYLQNVLTNAGTVEWLGGTFITVNYSGSYFGGVENLAGAVWDIECDQSVYNNYGTSTAYFHNAGTIQKSAGTGTSTIQVPFQNSGAVTAQTGTISLNGGGTVEGTFNASSGAAIHFGGGTFAYSVVPTLSGLGNIQLTGGALTLVNDVIPGLQMTGGTVSLNPAFQGGTITNLTLSGSTLAGTNTVTGTFNCGNGVNGALTVAGGATVNWSAGTITGELEITNGAVVNWSGGTAVGVVNVETNGLLNLAGGASKYLENVLTNAGTVEWLGGTLITPNYGSSFFGAMENLAGAVWDIQCDQSIYNNYGTASAYFHNAGLVRKSAGTGTSTIQIAFNNDGTVTADSGTIAFSAGGQLAGAFNALSGAAIYFSGGAFSYSAIPVLSGPGNIELTGGSITLLDDMIPGLQMVGGTVNLSPGFQGGMITNLTLSGSVLQGTNTVVGTFNCGNGVNGGLTVADGATVNWSGGTITGPLEVTNGAVVNWSGGTAGNVVNIETNGLLNITGNTTKYLQNALTNAGTVEWLGGTIITANYNGGYSGAVRNLAGAVWDVQCDQSMYNNYGSGSPYFYNAGLVQKSAGAGTTSVQIPFVNAGTVTAETGTIALTSGGTMEGTFNASSGATINFSGGTFAYGTVPTLNGPGDIRITGGGLTLLNDVIPGLQMTGGTITLGPSFQGGTITNLTLNGSTLQGTNAVTGTFNCANGVNGGLTVAGGATLNWSGGNITGYLEITNGAVVNWSGGAALSAVNVETNGLLNLITSNSKAVANVLTNAGTVEWLGGNFVAENYNGGYSGRVENLAGALFDVQCDAAMYDNYGGGSPYFHNAGLFQKSAGTGTTSIQIPLVNAGTVTALTGTIAFTAGGTMEGVFNASSGATINFNSGTFTYSTVPTLNGPGTIEMTGGTLTLANDIIPGLQMAGGTITLGPAFQGGTITNLTLNGTTLQGSNIVTGTFNCGNGVNGGLTVAAGATLNWTGGSITGLLEITNGAVVNWSSGTALSVVNVETNGLLNLITSNTKAVANALTNAGTVEWLGGNFVTENYNGGYSGRVENLAGALWDVQCDATIYDNYGGGSPYFHNAGVLQKSAGTGTTSIQIPFVNAATITAETGTISFNSGGTMESIFNASSGATINFSGGTFTYSAVPSLNGLGSYKFSGGTLTLVNDVIPALQMIGGTIILGPAFQGGTITNLTLSGSVLQGTNTVTGIFNCANGVSGALMVAGGATLNWTGGNITGLLEITNGAVVNWSGGTAYSVVNVETNALLNLLGSNTKVILTVLTNAGTVEWLSGAFAVDNYNGGYAGGVENLAGAVWDIQCDQVMYNPYGGGTPYFHNAGIVQKTVGTSTTTISIPFYNNVGTLDVETGVVSFNQNNSYGQTAGTLQFGLNGPSHSGKVQITGNIDFDGTLAADLVGGYVPQAGDNISLVTFTSRAGTFNNLNLPPLNPLLAWQVSYNSTALQLGVVSNANSTAQITGSVMDNSAHPVTNVTVVAYSTNANGGVFLSTVTDAGGQYSLNVSNGVWFVGLQGLPARGFNPVGNQVVTVSGGNQTVNFILQPYSLQYYTITTAVSPSGAGSASGGGTFASGAPATVSAVANTATLPYYFDKWTENGVFESASASYAFNVTRDRILTANFTLPTYQISATITPYGAGTVSGQGTYFYGTTNVLTATANYGYRFANWTQNGVVLATTLSFTNTVTSNRVVVANFAEANTSHVVTTATSPLGIATVTGAGTYTNGQTAVITAPTSVTLSPYIYTFRQFQLNGTIASYGTTINKTCTTLDPTNLDYVAVYDTKSILPTVVGLTAGLTNTVLGGFTVVTNPVPATTNYQVTLRFDRPMNTNIVPLVVITNHSAVVQPSVAAGGVWFGTTTSNDTYRTPFITFSNGMDGLAVLQVSGAQDPLARVMAPTNLAALLIDVTPPTNPVIALIASNSTSAEISWSTYPPPGDLGAFRIYLSTTNFTSVAGLSPITSLGSGTRAYWLSGLTLDQSYYAAVAAVDQAGNSSPSVTVLPFTLPSALPPPVTVQVTPVGASSVTVSWNGYDTSALLGFAGFQLYYETADFSSVTSLTPKQSLSAGTRSVQINNLDRTKTYHFAVVGYNSKNAFNPAVATASWSDPYAGNISSNLTLGGAGQTEVDILHSITVVNNAILTVPAGTTLRFAPGTGLTIQQGALFAMGTALDPVVFTSANDQPGLTPSAGDWNGVTLQTGASSSVLMNLFINYGGGLTLDGSSPTVQAFTAQNNIPAGLTVQNGGVLNTADALLTFNGIGVQQLGSSLLTITNSVIQNNGTNALAIGGLNLHANGDWWGSATLAAIDASLVGAVDSSSYLSGTPLLTPAIGTSNNVTQVGSQSVNLRLACRTATAMRLSEDSTFSGVFFSPFTNATPFALSSGGGQKTIFAQFRSVTGATNTPISIKVNYITGGPTISAFSLSEGQVLSRPLTVTASASAPLGMSDLELYVDGAGQGTNTGGSFSEWFDVRNFSAGVHRVELLARDDSGNVATLSLNVTISPTPPPAPVITVPSADLVVGTNSEPIAGTAEPYVSVRLFDSGTLAGVTNAAADGSFSFTASLVEGNNQIVAEAMDSVGSADSPVRNIDLDTTPPAQLIMNLPAYTPGSGLAMTWNYPSGGKRASNFEVFWSTAPITQTSQALGHTILLSTMFVNLQGLATGDYYFYVVGYDAIGNASPLSVPVTYHYDAVPPSFQVAYDKASPMGVGPVHVILTASEPLAAMPTLTVQPYGDPPSLLSLSNSTVNTYEGGINITALLPSGPVQMKVSGQDLAGNPFTGPPAGPQLVIDVTPPAGVITTAPLPPVQATNNTAVQVNLQLTEAPQSGTVPVLNFGPPTGSEVPVTMAGSGTNWNGNLTVTPAMGSGVGHFTLSVTDALANVGHQINAGEDLEIYNTALPSPPGQPVHFEATSLSAGQVLLTWSNVPEAEIYRVYSQTGNDLTVPTNLIADNIVTNQYIDLPATDGYYRYVVTASRRGSEGTNSIVRVAVSDRTPPPAPTNVTVQLSATGLQIAWQPGLGETPDHFNVYRNGTLIRTVTTATSITDNPPRGEMAYTVGADDALGNEALSSSVAIELLVGAVNNLQALLNAGQGPVLSWTSSDSTAVGFNVYRNGIKQNTTLLSSPAYTDTLPIGSDPVTYAVTALNSTNAESAARSVTVYSVNLALLVNPAGGTTNNPPVTGYFDDYLLSVTNLTASAALPLQQVEVLRQAAGTTALNIVNPVNGSVAAGATYAAELSVPCATNTSPQTVRLRAIQQTDSEGSSVIYQQNFNLPGTQPPGVMVEVSANQLPLAGGLTPFNVRIYNRGYTPIYFITARGNGAQPGDLYLSVLNPQGQEVSRTSFTGTPSGIIFNGSVGYLMIPPGSSTTLTVPNVLTPDALASNTVTFQAVVSTIYDRVTAAGQQASGPLVGSMQSALSQTPYYGTAQTDHQLYSGDQPIIITGQALDRVTGLPVPNVPLQIGFATRGYRWYQSVTTDSNGNYSYSYNVTPGLAGTLTIWAAHPDVVDQLNQAQVTIYRMYAAPPSGDIRMSKNDTLPFTIQLYNPGDVPLTSFTTTFQAYEMQGTNQVPITSLHGTNLTASSFSLGSGQKQTVTLQLAADADAPDNATVVFTLTSAEGASTTFTGNVTLLPAVPIISVVDPAVGYVEVSLDRGSLLSRQVSIVNSGLKDLQGVTLIPPTNVTWMSVNLPVSGDGTIHLPDLPVGATNTFTVVFTPPTNTDLGFYQDKFTVKGTNALAGFDVNLYARVTSSQDGAIQFYVDDILGSDVPNATVRLRNTDLQVELPPVTTDINGLVTVTNLQEGNWSWQVTASGYSANVGISSVIADQTVQTHTRLNKSLVTVNFTVTPVPFSDKYDITIEQTFETHVPIPVLVLTPGYQQFANVTPGYQATFIATAQNAGLVQMTDLSLKGDQSGSATLTPLITYVPVLGAEQSIQIPFTFTYAGTNAASTQQGLSGGDVVGCIPGNISGYAQMGADFLAGMAAIAQAYAKCPKDQTAIIIAASLGVGAFATFVGIISAVTDVTSAIESFLGCLLGTLIGNALANLSFGLGTVPQTSLQNFQPTTTGCFAAETRVLLADGRFKTIDQIKPGDVLRSGANRLEVATVGQTFERPDDTCRTIRFVAVDHSSTNQVITTDEHLFWVDGKGWVAAAQLTAGEWLMNDGGQRVEITGNQRLPGWHNVYTLKLRGDTAFYANGVLVHDLCGAWTSPVGTVQPAPATPVVERFR